MVHEWLIFGDYMWLMMVNNGNILGDFHKFGYPQSSSILDWDFPFSKPTIQRAVWGTPMTSWQPPYMRILDKGPPKNYLLGKLVYN